MDFKLFFKKFNDQKDKLDALEKQLQLDYTQFVADNRKEIKKFIPPIGTMVKYVGEPKITYEGKKWEFLKITDNRILSKPEYNNYIPQISVIPLDNNYSEIITYNERIGIDKFEIIDKEKQNKADAIGYIYLLTVIDTDIYKIGFSKTTDKRVTSIKTSSPLDVELVTMYKCYDAYKVEQELHVVFKGKKVNREWFKLDANDLDVLKRFISDFLIEEIENVIKETTTKEPKDTLPLESYEVEKREILFEFNQLHSKYIDKCKVVSVGDFVLDCFGHKHLVDKILLWDKLETDDKKMFINYQGYRVNGNMPSAKYNAIIMLKERTTVEFPYKEYLEEKSVIRKKYQQLKKEFASDFREFKKGDIVIDIFQDTYIIEDISFHDSIEWNNKAYFTYGGRKILKDGKLSEKYTSLHNVKKVIY